MAWDCRLPRGHKAPDGTFLGRPCKGKEGDAVSMDEQREQRRQTLYIEGPTAVCGDCGFTSDLSGAWSVEDGRLVFRADPSPLQRRGPDFFHCDESRDVANFTRIEIDGDELAVEDFTAIRREAERAT